MGNNKQYTVTFEVDVNAEDVHEAYNDTINILKVLGLYEKIKPRITEVTQTKGESTE